MSKQYDLTSFAGRLAAIAAGETLVMWQFIGKDWTIVGKPSLDSLARNGVGPLQETCYRWSIAPKPEKTVTITRKQLLDAVKKACLGSGIAILTETLTEELGLGEDE